MLPSSARSWMKTERAEFLGVSIVAYYGPKPAGFSEWLINLQKTVRNEFPGFCPRDLDQIHATIIDLQFTIRPTTSTDTLGALRYLADFFRESIAIRFGGYARGSAQFRSRGRDPYERSFVISASQSVLIGWPAEARASSAAPTNKLVIARRGLERYGFQHRYHQTPDDSDPDCYLVIGCCPDTPSAIRRSSNNYKSGEDAIRRYLSGTPYSVHLSAADLSVVHYENVSLDAATSIATPLLEALRPMENEG